MLSDLDNKNTDSVVGSNNVKVVR